MIKSCVLLRTPICMSLMSPVPFAPFAPSKGVVFQQDDGAGNPGSLGLGGTKVWAEA